MGEVRTRDGGDHARCGAERRDVLETYLEEARPEGLSACFATETTESTERFDMKTTVQRKAMPGHVSMVVGFVGFAILLFILRGELHAAFGIRPALVLMIIAAAASAASAMVFMKYLTGNNGAVAHGQPGVVRGTLSDETVSPSVISVSSVAKTATDARTNSVSSVAENPAAIFSATSLRLRREIAALSRRGNLNLTIGVITTGFALSLLAYMIFDESTSPDSFAAALSHYVPRVTTVTFIEVFSFFFLKLYRASLIEIKFYQNELTSLASLQIALATSRDCPDPDAVRTVLDQLSRRNPNGSQAISLQPSALSPVPEDSTLATLADLLTRVAGFATAARLK
ncbi:MAG: hypothetical protein HY897_03655 [Deltaproteobacteria bacterium]|nr:hypothetical protein [Deltaproteobacteria bacterium]